MKSILGYAFGPTLDSVVRLASILRRLVAWGDVEAHILSNQAVSDQHKLAGFTFYQCPPQAKAIAAKLHEMLERVAPQLVLVDRFPLGVDGELPAVLPEFPCPAVLVEGAGGVPATVRVDIETLVRTTYDFCIAPADVLPYREYGRCLQVEPVVACEPEDFEDVVDARRVLHQSGKPILLFHEEAGVRLYERLRRECTTSGGLRIEWRLATQDMSLAARFPGECLHEISLHRLHAGIGAVVAPSTYSHFHETESSGVPALFVAMGGALEYANRRGGANLFTDVATLARRIHDGKLPEPRAAQVYTGARRAAEFLRQYVGHRPKRLGRPPVSLRG